MKFFLSIIIYFTCTFCLSSLKKDSLMEDTIDPSLYSQVLSYYTDLYQKTLDPNFNFSNSSNITINEEELNAYQLIEELSNKTQSKKVTKLPIFQEQNKQKNESLFYDRKETNPEFQYDNQTKNNILIPFDEKVNKTQYFSQLQNQNNSKNLFEKLPNFLEEKNAKKLIDNVFFTTNNNNDEKINKLTESNFYKNGVIFK